MLSKIGALKLSTRLLLAFLVVGVIPFSIIGVVSMNTSSNALHRQAFQQLEGVRGIKKAQIEQFFAERQGDMGVLSETIGNFHQKAIQQVAAAQELKKKPIENIFKTLQTYGIVFSQMVRLQDAFVSYDRGFRNGKAQQSEGYKKSVETYQPFLKELMASIGVYDIFLINDDGDLIATAAQEADVWTNLKSGPYKDSNLAEAWRKAVAKPYRGKEGIVWADFKYYEPSKDHAAFMVVRFAENSNKRGRWQKGESIGCLAFQLSPEPINQITQQRAGMGKTGESYLVGNAYGTTSYRSNLVIGDGKIGQPENDEGIAKALKGQAGIEIHSDRNGVLQIEAYEPLNISGLHWVLISNMNFEEAISPQITGDSEDFYSKYIKKYGYYDLFLFSPDGNCFYTVAKEADYHTNFANGTYADSNLGKLFRQIVASESYGVSDFAPYGPSNNEPAAFIAQPYIHNGKLELVIGLQLSLDAINKVMQQRDGMGETGETYLVGKDKLMRSDSFLDPVGHSVVASFANPSQGMVDTKASTAALAGETDSEIIIDYNGNPVLSAYTPLSVGGVTWALIAEIDQAEAFAPVWQLRKIITLVAFCCLLLIVALALFVAKSIAGPITQVSNGMKEGADQVSNAAGQVSISSQTLAEGATEQAASLEETSASLEEIASMTSQNAENAREADRLMGATSDVVGFANSSMQELKGAMLEINASSAETSRIVKTIDEIAFQTNLLALNAAVEAARAGEAGAGFAVVAEEVRNLAMRAASAAKDTSSLLDETVVKVEKGTSLVTKTEDAFGQVDNSSQKIALLISEIFAACEQQNEGISQITATVSQMDQVTQSNAATAEESASASEELSAQSIQMLDHVRDLVVIIQGNKEGTVAASSPVDSMTLLQ